MFLVILSILCMYAELKLKPLNFLLPCHFYNTESLSAKSQVYILLYDFQTSNSKSLNHEILIKFYVPH